MNLDKAPLPRFWYLPRGEKAAVILTGDDHAVGGTPAVLRPAQGGLAGRLLGRRLGVRARDVVRLSRTRRCTAAQANAYQAAGFEIALHLNTGCHDFTPASLEADFASQLGAFSATWPGLAPPVSNRTHCIVWSDWATQPKVERAHGIRFDTNYYYKGPPAWVRKPGLMTGSGFPQRFGDLDGTMIDVYQSMTQVSDEMDEILPTTTQIHTLLDNALGPKDYWGVFNVILHSDLGDHGAPQRARRRRAAARRADRHLGADAVVARQPQRLVVRQHRLQRQPADLHADARTRQRAACRRCCPPARPPARCRSSRRGGQPVSWNRQDRQGRRLRRCSTRRAAPTRRPTRTTRAPPTITGISATADAEGHATVSWTTDEPSTSIVQYGRTTALGSEVEDTRRGDRRTASS